MNVHYSGSKREWSLGDAHAPVDGHTQMCEAWPQGVLNKKKDMGLGGRKDQRHEGWTKVAIGGYDQYMLYELWDSRRLIMLF